MDPLPLDPNGYPGTYKLVGGRPCLDLVNTISWPETDREHDWLTRPNLTTWLDAVALTPFEAAESDLSEVRLVRELITDVLRPLANGERPPSWAIERFNTRLSRALGRRRLDPDELTWSWAPSRDVDEVLDPVVVDAAEVVADGDRDRLKLCPSCRWLFEDQTRNGQRRWCDMADCGSRAKARSYYQRHKA